MKIRLVALSVMGLASGIAQLRRPAQAVIIGEPGWFQAEGAPAGAPPTK